MNFERVFFVGHLRHLRPGFFAEKKGILYDSSGGRLRCRGYMHWTHSANPDASRIAMARTSPESHQTVLEKGEKKRCFKDVRWKSDESQWWMSSQCEKSRKSLLLKGTSSTRRISNEVKKQQRAYFHHHPSTVTRDMCGCTVRISEFWRSGEIIFFW